MYEFVDSVNACKYRVANVVIISNGMCSPHTLLCFDYQYKWRLQRVTIECLINYIGLDSYLASVPVMLVYLFRHVPHN